MSEAARNAAAPWMLELIEGHSTPIDSSCIGVAENAPAQVVLNWACNFGLTHLVQKEGHEFETERRSAENLVLSPDLFRRHPAACILNPERADAAAESRLIVFDSAFQASKQKRLVLEALTAKTESLGLAASIREDAVLVGDELFTNAVFNAPFVDPVTSENPGIDRHTADVVFDEDQRGRLFLARDESRLVIGCADPFGSLNLPRWLLKIRETFLRGPAAAMNFGPGGAGLGSYIIFNAGSSLYFGNWPGELTLLCCVFPLGMSNRKRIQLPKHLHLIQG